MMEHILDYKIVSTNQSDALERAVKKWMKQGWKPFGSPFTTSLHMYNQSIVLCEEEDEAEWRDVAETIR